MALRARQRLPVGTGALASRTPLRYRALPQPSPSPRWALALLWVYRLLFVRPVGRRARAERLAALPDRILRDIGVKRAQVQADAWGVVRLRDVLPSYPRAGPLFVCGAAGFRPTLVRLPKAA